MRLHPIPAFYALAALACTFCLASSLMAEPPQEKAPDSEEQNATDKTPRVSVEVARERAKLTHNIYASTLEVIHHRYFRDDRAVIPARAMEDVFADIAENEGIKANWIAVNAKPMNIHHRPKDDFEKLAAKTIAAGKPEYESVENGLYRRAVGISLMKRGCLTCHLGFGKSSKIDRFAGLVITIPVNVE